jgi:hypothetical protein
MQARIKPDEITNQMLNDMGTAYLALHPQPTLWHSNQPVANAFATYSEDNNTQSKWLFLADNLMKLWYGAKRGELAHAIENLYAKAFPDSPVSERAIYQSISRYYNSKLYDMVRSLALQHAGLSKTNSAASSVLSTSSPFKTAEPLYPVFNTVDDSNDNTQKMKAR